MAIYPTGNAIFDAGVRQLESARQLALSAPGLSQAQAAAADLAWLTGVAALGQVSGISTINGSTGVSAIASTGAP